MNVEGRPLQKIAFGAVYHTGLCMCMWVCMARLHLVALPYCTFCFVRCTRVCKLSDRNRFCVFVELFGDVCNKRETDAVCNCCTVFKTKLLLHSWNAFLKRTCVSVYDLLSSRCWLFHSIKEIIWKQVLIILNYQNISYMSQIWFRRVYGRIIKFRFN